MSHSRRDDKGSWDDRQNDYDRDRKDSRSLSSKSWDRRDGDNDKWERGHHYDRDDREDRRHDCRDKRDRDNHDLRDDLRETKCSSDPKQWQHWDRDPDYNSGYQADDKGKRHSHSNV